MELFDATHKNKKGELCSEKARDSIFKYCNLLAEKYGEDCSAYPDFDKVLWNEATGGNLHGDNYGFGALGQSRAMGHVGTNSLPTETTLPDVMITNLDPKVVKVITKQVTKSVKKSMKKKFKMKLKNMEIKLLRKLVREGRSHEVGSATTSTSRRRHRKDVVVQSDSDNTDSDSSDDSESDSSDNNSNSDSYSRVVESSQA